MRREVVLSGEEEPPQGTEDLAFKAERWKLPKVEKVGVGWA